MKFGTPVRIRAEVVALYVLATRDRAEVKGSWTEWHNDGPLRYLSAKGDRLWSAGELALDGIPGSPLPKPSPLPDTQGTFRVLRRFPRDARGLVVGRTWRLEGRYHHASTAYRDDYDPARLESFRRVEVYQVAIDPGDVGQRRYRADIALALPNDLSAL